jgi:hypothetical protein
MHAYVTDDGFTLRVYDAGYLDWALQIQDPDGRIKYDNLYALTRGYCGYAHWEDETREARPWSESEWKEWFEQEADGLLETFLYSWGEPDEHKEGVNDG